MACVPALARAVAAAASVLAAAVPSGAQPRPPAAVDSAGVGPGYAFHADLVAAAPLIVDALVRGATRIKGAEAAAAAPGATRFYVEADVAALIRGAGGLPTRIGYVVDTFPDAAGRLPRLKKMRVLLFARAVAGAPDQLQLVSPDAQVDWTPQGDALVRRIAREVLAADAPPAVTGVGSVFHVPGSLPGEGETQIFLLTADARPVSLSVLRRPGEQPRWAVALSEIVDEAAGPPPRDTLLWYRLACFLPGALPQPSLAALSPPDADAAREDYRFVLGQLGACGPRARLIGGGAPA